jgi:hypothetical protein
LEILKGSLTVCKGNASHICPANASALLTAYNNLSQC